jgi:hypothetical protein
MLLKWREQNEYGEVVERSSFEINLDNVESYARRNCRKCYGRGWEKMDSGANPLNKFYRAENIEVREPNLNERVVTCSCVDNHLARLDRIKDQK